MSKIVFMNIPAHGHTNPTLAVVRGLIERGHVVRYYSYEPFREKIEATGAEFVPCDAYDAELKLDPRETEKVGKDLLFSIRLLVETTLSLDEVMMREMSDFRPDVIVGDSMAVWAKMIARKLGIPFVSSTTTFAFNRHSAKLMKQGIGRLLSMIVAIPKLQREVVRLKARGYPIENFVDLIQNDETTDTIVYTSPEFQPCSETFADCYEFVGPMMREAVEVYKKSERPLVYISLGTVNNRMMRFYANCIKAFADGEFDVLMSVGEKIDIAELGEVSPNITIKPHVDQMAVLAVADVFITHCGMNSASEGIYDRVPLVTFAQTDEQCGVARRVRELGCGLELKRISPKVIRQTVEKAKNDLSIKQNLESISESFKRFGGVNAAILKIQSVVK